MKIPVSWAWKAETPISRKTPRPARISTDEANGLGIWTSHYVAGLGSMEEATHEATHEATMRPKRSPE
jgi:hypothetical protein